MALPDLANNFETLKKHWKRLQSVPVRKLFDEDDKRFDKMSVRLDNLIFDYSKNHVDADVLAALFQLAKDANVEKRRDDMFAGEKINETENRAVLHTALRACKDEQIFVDGEDVIAAVHQMRERLSEFAESVRAGEYKPSGKKIKHVVNIGIGGSDLGPKMVTRALSAFADGPSVHFVSNVDGTDIDDTLRDLDPKSMLFIIASKTFTTQETMVNARTAMNWVKSELGDSAPDHFCAVSTNLVATREFGIPDERTFGFRDWVGGRFSVWSSIGLSVIMAIGSENFEEFLEGAEAADKHFKTAQISQNIPVLMALIGVWHRNVCGFSAQAVLPYDDRMEFFPSWLQQLDMESNGKSTRTDGSMVHVATGPVVFGEPGTNGQHAFYQLLHQGTDPVPCDFLVAAKGSNDDLDEHHKILLANCLAQSEALMRGRTLTESGGEMHRTFEGSRPSNTFLYQQLNPFTLGMLMAFFEHKIFVQGAIWGINSFDQWGVELGKEVAGSLLPLLESEDVPSDSNSSTAGLICGARGFCKN